MRYIAIIILLATLSSCHGQPTDSTMAFKAYRTIWEGNSYSVLMIDPKQYNVRIESDHHGNALQGFAYLKNRYDSIGRELLLAMNAGMFHKGGTPVGLLIDNYTELNPIVLNVDTNKRGNFYNLPPNGIFWIDSNNTAVVTTTGKYPAATKGRSIRTATQSGPMLIYDGNLNKAFRKGSSNLNIRNGVGITNNGLIVFVISDVEVNFYDMATLYRDHLLCNNALYLDGSISKMYLPAIGRDVLNDSGHLNPIITVTAKP